MDLSVLEIYFFSPHLLGVAFWMFGSSPWFFNCGLLTRTLDFCLYLLSYLNYGFLDMERLTIVSMRSCMGSRCSKTTWSTLTKETRRFTSYWLGLNELADLSHGSSRASTLDCIMSFLGRKALKTSVTEMLWTCPNLLTGESKDLLLLWRTKVPVTVVGHSQQLQLLKA